MTCVSTRTNGIRPPVLEIANTTTFIHCSSCTIQSEKERGKKRDRERGREREKEREGGRDREREGGRGRESKVECKDGRNG